MIMGRPMACAMILDYCPEISWRLMREQGRLSPSLSADIMLSLHRLWQPRHEGIIHRDLKPENVILMETSPGRYHARLLDFGITKRTDDDEPRLTQANMVFGTRICRPSKLEVSRSILVVTCML